MIAVNCPMLKFLTVLLKSVTLLSEDAKNFMDRLAECRDNPLKVLTDDCHFHTVAAPSEKLLDLIEAELAQKGFLQPIQE